MTTTPPGSDPTATPSDRLWLRSELMGTQVITRDTGRRLGVVAGLLMGVALAMSAAPARASQAAAPVASDSSSSAKGMIASPPNISSPPIHR